MSYTNEHMMGKYVRCINTTFSDQELGEYYRVIEETRQVWCSEEPKYCVRVEDLNKSDKHILFKDQWEPVTVKEILKDKPHYITYLSIEECEEAHEFEIEHLGGSLMRDSDGGYWNIINITQESREVGGSVYRVFNNHVIYAKNHKNETAVLLADAYKMYEAGGKQELVSFENLRIAYVEK